MGILQLAPCSASERKNKQKRKQKKRKEQKSKRQARQWSGARRRGSARGIQRAGRGRAHHHLHPKPLFSCAEGVLDPELRLADDPRVGPAPSRAGELRLACSQPPSPSRPRQRLPRCPSRERLCLPAARLLPFWRSWVGQLRLRDSPHRGRAPSLGPPQGLGDPARRRAPLGQPHLSPERGPSLGAGSAGGVDRPPEQLEPAGRGVTKAAKG